MSCQRHTNNLPNIKMCLINSLLLNYITINPQRAPRLNELKIWRHLKGATSHFVTLYPKPTCLCLSPPLASRAASATVPSASRPPVVRGHIPGPPSSLNPSPAFGVPPVPSRPGSGQMAYTGDPNSGSVPLVPSRPARVPPALPPGIPR